MNEPSPPLLQLENVSRRLGGRAVVQALDLTLRHGQVLGLLGVNGAGKSTTLAMMAAAQQPDAGRVRIEGADLAEHPQLARTRIGWLPERAPLWPDLNVNEHLDAVARLRGMRGAQLRSRRTQVLESLGLEREARRLVGVLSQGQRQRVGLACALLHEPPLLVLDEPGNGLDPLQAAHLRELIRERAGAGCGVVLSTHLLPEVTAVCDRVAILHDGRLRHDTPLSGGRDRLLLTLARPVERGRVAGLQPVAAVHSLDGCRHEVTLRGGSDAAALAQAVVAAGLPLSGLQPAADELEQAFLRIATQHANPMEADAA